MLVTLTAAAPDTRRLTRRLVPAQALYTLGVSVDLTLTGIVGHHLAPTPALATLPFSLIPVVAATTTFALSRWIGRRGYRRVFTFAAAVAVPAGLVSALAVQLHQFWLFCLGTALIGVYQAGAGYYRYAAAESNPTERARAVSTVLAGGLVAALVGPFLATTVSTLTPTPYVASYLVVAAGRRRRGGLERDDARRAGDARPARRPPCSTTSRRVPAACSGGSPACCSAWAPWRSPRWR